MPYCNFGVICGTPCGDGATIPFSTCDTNISSHLNKWNMNGNENSDNEQMLILARCFATDTDTTSFTICNDHRTTLGKSWLRRGKKCGTFQCPRKSIRKGITIPQSIFLYKKYGDCIQPGTGSCPKCITRIRGEMASEETGAGDENVEQSDHEADMDLEGT